MVRSITPFIRISQEIAFPDIIETNSYLAIHL